MTVLLSEILICEILTDLCFSLSYSSVQDKKVETRERLQRKWQGLAVYIHCPLDKTDQLKNLKQKHWLCHYTERAAQPEVRRCIHSHKEWCVLYIHQITGIEKTQKTSLRNICWSNLCRITFAFQMYGRYSKSVLFFIMLLRLRYYIHPMLLHANQKWVSQSLLSFPSLLARVTTSTEESG